MILFLSHPVQSRRSTRFAAAFVLVLGALSATPAKTAEMDFMGAAVEPARGRFLVGSDANVRDKPTTDGKKVGKLDEGEIVEVVGKVAGSKWYAVRQGEMPLGFVYADLLTPIINGELGEDVTGELQVQPNLRCGFRIHFTGKTEGEGQPMQTSDYDATIVCERNAKRIRFPAQMFITEIPFDGSDKRRVFQINLDLLDGVQGLDEIFSTTMLFDYDQGRVAYDGMTERTYERKGVAVNEMPATNVPRALASAMELALRRWSEKAWDDIFSNNG